MKRSNECAAQTLQQECIKRSESDEEANGRNQVSEIQKEELNGNTK